MDIVALIERVLADRSINFSITLSRDSIQKSIAPLRAGAEGPSSADGNAELGQALRDTASSDFAGAYDLLVSKGFPENDDTIWLARAHGVHTVRRCVEKMERTKTKKPIADESAYLRTCLKNIERRNT